MQITDRLFAAFVQCRYKARLLSEGQVGVVSAYEQLESDLDNAYRTKALRALAQRYGADQVAYNPNSLVEAIAHGYRLIIGCSVVHGDVSAAFESLERPDQTAVKGSEFVPTLFVYREKLTFHDKLRAAFHASVLSDVLGTAVTYGRIIHGSGTTASKVQMSNSSGRTGASKYVQKARNDLAKFDTGKVPPLVLNEHCSICEFQQRCYATAVEKDDLSLLRRMSVAEIDRQHERGIFTVRQLSYTFRAKSVTGRAAERPAKHQLSLQALAIRENRVFVARQPELRTSLTRVFLDVEGLPDRDFYYLVGVIIDHGGTVTTHSLWADDLAGEKAIWHGLLGLLRGLGDFVIYHYGRYEKAFFEHMRKRYGSPAGQEPLVESLGAKLVNVLSEMSGRVYFPTYSHNLKAIGAILGARWSDPNASGKLSIVWRHRWEMTGDIVHKDALIRYNTEDCFALQKVTDALRAIAERPSECGLDVLDVAAVPSPEGHRFGRRGLALPGFGRIVQCAYFDYQTNKVFFRTVASVRKSIRRKGDCGRMPKPTKTIACDRPTVCPQCRSGHLSRAGRKLFTKTVNDLRFSRSGVRRCVLQYETYRYRCGDCGRMLFSHEYPSNASRFGHGLSSWAIHSHVALRQSFDDVTDAINDSFGYAFRYEILKRIKPRMADIYRETQTLLQRKLLAGHVLYVDEMKVQVKGGIGYVWAFTNLEEVVYLFNSTRDGTVLDGVIGGFKGVLVSDFYGIYDSPECPQQKCVLHFARDLNDDLMKAPFDDELSELGRDFSALFTPIVDSIDKFGLKQRHLNPHKGRAERFLKAVADRDYASSLAQHYQRRLAKYGSRMFTFLSYDNVTWNNNAAENALKLLASRRRLIGAGFSQEGIRDYLVFLGIFCTLRRKGASMLRFLLSREIDIDQFLAGRQADQ